MGNTAYLALGTNLGDKLENLRSAVRLLRESGCKITGVSSLYSTKPVGVKDQPDFLNAVIRVETVYGPKALLGLCQSIELRLGRERTIRWGPRVIDVDILLYDDLVMDEPSLTLPHPEMSKRAFVLAPLAEIDPEVEIEPGTSASDALAAVDVSGVEQFSDRSWSN